MEELNNKNNNTNKQIMFSIIGIAILIVAVAGVTYSFFNYTRTGAANNIGTGRIYFNMTQNGALNMTNIFPLKSTETNNAVLDTVSVGIVGDTTYDDGEEFEITLVDVTNTINGKKIPINYIATYTAVTGKNIGEESDDYWNARNSKNADIYTLTETGSVEDGKQVLVGYIKNSASGVSGTLTIKAYIDADRIAISDTYPEGLVNQSSNNLEGLLPSKIIQEGGGGSGSINPLPNIDGPMNGTTSEWVNGRTVLTTEEWNSFQSSGTPISFKIKAESNEGIWVEEPAQGTIESCPNCKFIYTTESLWTTWNTNSQSPTVLTSGYSTNYNDIVTNSGKNYFLGVVTNASNQITNAYACGVKDNVPFCIEGTSDGSKYTANQTLINGANLWNNTCTVESIHIECGSWDGNSFFALAHSYGYVEAGVSDDFLCYVSLDGEVYCY